VEQAAAGSAAGAGQANPTLARMAVGSRLRWHREECGLSREDAGAAIGVPAGQILAMERGDTRLTVREVGGLCAVYELGDLDERATLLGLARQANGPEWWHPYQDVIPAWFTRYLSLERAARVIRCYVPQVIPALLQIPAYTRALLGASHAGTAHDLARRVELRARRQEILHQRQPVRLWTVIDEAALRRPVGGTVVMREQIQHLISMCDVPHVTIAVLPFACGARLSASGPASLLRLPDPRLPDMVYLDLLTGGLYLDEPAERTFYWHLMNQLAITAESVGSPQVILRQILQETITSQ
jgi:DNA-binding XRE family transcriptional regulator